MSHSTTVTVGAFDSQALAEAALQALEQSGFDFKRLFLIRAEYGSGPEDSRRRLRKSIAAGLIVGALGGSWTGKALISIPPLLALAGQGPGAGRMLATIENAILAGALGTLGALLYNARPGRQKEDLPQEAQARGAPFRIEVRGSPEEIEKARRVLEGVRCETASV